MNPKGNPVKDVLNADVAIERSAMEKMSHELLAALWREHPRIMRPRFLKGTAAGRP